MCNRFFGMFLLTASLGTEIAFGEVVIECREIGTDVVCVANGSLNVSTLGLFSTAQLAGGLMHPIYGSLQVGSMTGSPSDYYRLPAGVHMGQIGTGGLSAPALGSAAHWGISGAINVGRDHLIVPTGYVSGDPLPESSSTYFNHSFASLGLTPGVYRVNWGNGANADRLTIRIVATTLIGDVNQDGNVDLLDIAPFVDLVSQGDFQIEADVNNDGIVDLLDVAPFVNLLAGS